MFKNLIILLLCFYFISCKNENNDMEVLNKKLDNISKQIEKLQLQNNSTKQIEIDSNSKKIETIQIKSPTAIVQVELIKTKKETSVKQIPQKNDTIFHLFANGKISAK